MPIPSHVTAFVAGRNDAGARLFPIIRRGNLQPFVIEAPASTNFPQVSSKHEPLAPPSYQQYEEADKERDFKLEQIQTILRTIDFERANWAYFLVQPDGRYRITYRRKRMRSFTCPIWAPLVEERDITITKWHNCELREGLWRNIPVDINIAWEDTGARYLDKMTWGMKKLLGLDVTYELLGHVVRDGEVIGFITQLATGRMVRCGDEALVYDAFAKIQRHGLIYKSIGWGDIMISLEGKVRLLYPSVVDSYPDDPKRLEEEGNLHHWEEIRLMFEDIVVQNINLGPRHAEPEYVIILADIPPPERLLDIRIPIRSRRSPIFGKDDGCVTVPKRSKGHSKGKSHAISLIVSTDSARDLRDHPTLHDSNSIDTVEQPLSRRVMSSQNQPTGIGYTLSSYSYRYDRRMRYQHMVLASALDDSECESSTTSSIVEVSEFDKSWLVPNRDSNTPVSSPEDH